MLRVRDNGVQIARRARRRVARIALIAAAVWGFAGAAAASNCIGIGQGPLHQDFSRGKFAVGQPQNPLWLQVSKPTPPPKSAGVTLTFIGHSTFVIETPRGVRIATDYNDYVKPPFVPDIVTMNRAHSTHFTNNPPPGIKHVLRGWAPEGGVPEHNVKLGDVFVRNVATNIRDFAGAYGNSIFIFETGGLCIGHLGHLHHTLTPEQLEQIGQLDVVLVPVDGSYTLDVAGMVDVLKALKARLIVPMHYFNNFTLTRFIDRIRGDFAVEQADGPRLEVSRASLPLEPKVVILPGN